MSSPTRFVDDRDAPNLVRAALRGARGDLPDAAHVDALGAALAATIAKSPLPGGGRGGDGGPGPAPAGGGGGGAVPALSAAKIAGVVGAVTAVAVGGTWLATAPSSGTRTAPRATTSAPAPIRTPTSTPTPPPYAAPFAAPVDVHALPEVAAPRPTAARGEVPSSPPSAPDEIALLRAGQDALESSPAEALARCDEAARRFPDGALAQEREVLAVDALLRLGRRADAEARAARFRAAHAGSAYLRRLDALLGR